MASIFVEKTSFQSIIACICMNNVFVKYSLPEKDIYIFQIKSSIVDSAFLIKPFEF